LWKKVEGRVIRLENKTLTINLPSPQYRLQKLFYIN